MTLQESLTYSLESEVRANAISRIIEAALAAVDPHKAVLDSLRNSGFCSPVYPGAKKLSQYKRITVIGAGKAGQPMAEAAEECFAEYLTRGIVIVKDGYTKKSRLSPIIKVLEASHPVPNQRGVDSTRNIIELLRDSNPDDLVICLISGGGSALLVSPVPGISLDEIQQVTELLLASGATINEINTLRKHLDQVKGGQLARIASPAKLLGLILSDVVGNPLDAIASGPTIPDPTTFQDAMDILDRYSIRAQIPPAVLDHLQLGIQGKKPETPKPGSSFFSNVENIIVGSNHTATEAARSQAEIEGFHCLTLTNYLQGEARQAGSFLASIMRQLALQNQPIPRPACLVIGGETTVTLKGRGLGGRNQEVALGAVSELSGLEDIALITLATDGGDGPSDAAGAVVTGSSRYRAHELGLNPDEFLAENNSYNFFAPLGDLLITGPTQTNVNDLTFLFAF